MMMTMTTRWWKTTRMTTTTRTTAIIRVSQLWDMIDLGFSRGDQEHQWHQPHDDDNEEEDNEVEDNSKDDKNNKDNNDDKGILAL